MVAAPSKFKGHASGHRELIIWCVGKEVTEGNLGFPLFVLAVSIFDETCHLKWVDYRGAASIGGPARCGPFLWQNVPNL